MPVVCTLPKGNMTAVNVRGVNFTTYLLQETHSGCQPEFRSLCTNSRLGSLGISVMTCSGSIQVELQCVSEMNLHGILLARKAGNNQQEVIECLLLAMTKLRSMKFLEKSNRVQSQQDTPVIPDLEEESTSSFSEEETESSPITLTAPYVHDMPAASMSLSCGPLLQSIPLDKNRQSEESDSFYLLNRALHVDITGTTSFDPSIAAVALSGAIVYNLGLFSCLQCSNNLHQQEYSLQLFHRSYETFASVPPSAATNQVQILGCLAAINNMGTLHSRSFQHAQAQKCADILSRHLLLLDQHEEDCFHHFNMNIVCYQSARFCAAGMA